VWSCWIVSIAKNQLTYLIVHPLRRRSFLVALRLLYINVRGHQLLCGLDCTLSSPVHRAVLRVLGVQLINTTAYHDTIHRVMAW
jgi:hypothetical protein